MNLSVITPIVLGRDKFIGDAARSIEALRNEISVQWVVVWDGPKEREIPGASLTLGTGRRQGISPTRNAALSVLESPYSTTLDADDVLNIEGCLQALAQMSRLNVGWVGCNRTLLDGTHTAHWKDVPREFSVGELATGWTAPFEFHPNSVIYQSSLLKRIGGWPAISCNEDLGLLLLASEKESGYFLPEVLTRYRVWHGQEVSTSDYPERKVEAFRYIEAVVNAERDLLGRPPISRPQSPGGAFGTLRRDSSR